MTTTTPIDQLPKWLAACDKLTGVHCGRLDMSTWSGDGQEMQRFVYSDQHHEKTRTEVSGPYCDEVAFMATQYPKLRQATKYLALVRRLVAEAVELIGSGDIEKAEAKMWDVLAVLPVEANS